MNVVIRGNVTVKLHGIRKQKPLSGSWAVLHDEEGKDNPPCIELFESNTETSCTHKLVLEHLKFPDKSYRQEDASLTLSIKKEKHHLQFDSSEDKEDWVQALCHVSTDLWRQRGTGKEVSETDSDSMVDMSDNLLYDSWDKVLQFKVSVNPNKTSEALGLKGHYLLNPTQDSLRLLELDNPKSLHEWRYRQIRKFGCTRKIFKMEVGRRCSTGAGEFEFFTPEGSALAERIKLNTEQVYSKEHRQLEPSVSAPPHMEVGGQNPARINSTKVLSSSVKAERPSDIAPSHKPPPGPLTQPSPLVHASENEYVQEPQQVTEEGSLDSKPKPLPRASKTKKEINATDQHRSRGVSSSSDTKIYETASGLTAPLDPQLKNELSSKLHVQLTPEATEVEEDPVSNTSETGSSRHDSIDESSISSKDRKKIEKERKKMEKEQKAAEAKRKKQEEKELKEKKEREEKEEKERQKAEKERLKKEKKESKNLSKQKGKKSFDQAPVPPMSEGGKKKSFDQAPTPVMSDGNIYDEPGELLLRGQAAAAPDHSLPPDPGYCEADEVVPGLAKLPIYATPIKSKNSWKTHGRPDSEHVHHENFEAIERASQASNAHDWVPPIPPQMTSGDGDDTYDHLGGFKPPPAPLSEHQENVYGMASAKSTVQSASAPGPGGGENDYEEAESVCTRVGPAKKVAQEVRSEYEDTSVSPAAGAAIQIGFPDEGDYAEVSHS